MSWLPERADWLRADEAAAWLGVSEGNLRVIAHRKGWGTVRVGRHTAYLADDVADEAQRRAESGDHRAE